MGAYVPMLGASGAVYGVLLAFGMTFPDAVILMFLIIPMKAKGTRRAGCLMPPRRTPVSNSGGRGDGGYRATSV